MSTRKQNQPAHTRTRVGYIDDDWLIEYNRGAHRILELSQKQAFERIKTAGRWDRSVMKAARKLADLRWIKRQMWEREGIDPPIEELPEDEWKDSL